MKRKSMQLVLLVGLIVNSIPVGVAQTPETMLILYTNTTERDFFLDTIDTENITVTSRLITDDLIETFNGYDMVFLLATDDFSLDSETEDNLQGYVQNEEHIFFAFSPYLSRINSNTQDFLGVDNVRDLYDDLGAVWDIQITKPLSEYNTSTHFEYTGPLVELELLASAEILAQAISSNSSDGSISYPLPLLINSTIGAQSYISPISMMDQSGASSLQLMQSDLDFISDLISQVVNAEVNPVPAGITGENTSEEPTQPQDSNEQTTDNSTNSLPPTSFPQELNSVLVPFLFLIATLVLLFYRQIWGLIRRIYEKTMGMVFVVGAYFTIQNRNISDNEVLYNVSRNEIITQLNSLREFGAHLRELKAMVGMGTGNLLWHLQILEDYDLIEKFNIGRNTVFVSRDHAHKFDRRFKEIELKLSSGHSKAILKYLLMKVENGLVDVPLKTVIEDTTINRRTVTRALKKLAKHEIVELVIDRQILVEITNAELIKQLCTSINLREQQETHSAIRVDYVDN